jgi:methyltransferase (TIGR00027 family)
MLEAVRKGAKQIVFVGVGFDFRAFRLMNNETDIKIFELDLPHMLVEREKIISTFTHSCKVQRNTIEVNLELEDVAAKLLCSGTFDSSVRTFFILEGASMYFNEDVNRRILTSIRGVMTNPQSRLWVDMVSRSVIEGTTGYVSVERFVKGMEKLGEPFIFGLNDPDIFFAGLGFHVQKVTPSNFYRNGLSDEVFALYNFYLLSG